MGSDVCKVVPVFLKKSHRPSVSRRHGSFHPLKHKPRREPLPQYVHTVRAHMTTNVMFSVHGLRGHGGPLFLTHLFFHFPEKEKVVLPPQVCYYSHHRRQEKWVTGTHRKPSSCHMQCGLTDRLPVLRIDRESCCRRGCGFLNGLVWPVLSTEWNNVISLNYKNR